MADKRYIDASALYNRVKAFSETAHEAAQSTAEMIAAWIADAPDEDVAPVVRAQWIVDALWIDTLRCSRCDYNIPDAEMITPYCPWCGAKMDGDSNDV